MYGNINPRQMKQAMKRLGINEQQIEAKRVIIELEGSRLVIDEPSVSKINMMGQEVYQISGEERTEQLDVAPEISEEDINTVMDSCGCEYDTAKEAILSSNGDLAKAILDINSNDSQ
jgi:nascent polypeptide-associated complex subunit alpha